jgi:Skp family chaperone for outer membrane proteins
MKRLLFVSTALAALAVAVPASAQVSGIGIAEPAIVVAGSAALNGAYQQITTMYQSQRTQLDQLDQQRVNLLKPFDTNNDGQLNDAEQKAMKANAATSKQLDTIEQQMNQLQQPINLAAIYAVSQIAQQLSPAVQQVVSQGGVQLILPSEGVLYHSQAADLNQKITAALNTRLPQVSITPPAGWQPDQGTVQLFQQVQQVRLEAAALQQQQQQQQRGAAATPTPAPAPAGKPAGNAPVKGR